MRASLRPAISWTRQRSFQFVEDGEVLRMKMLPININDFDAAGWPAGKEDLRASLSLIMCT